MGLWKIIILVTGVLVFIITFIVHWKKLYTNTKLSFLFTFIFLVIGPILTDSLIDSTPPDYYLKNRPYLEPVVKVEELNYPGAKFSFEITNIGKLPAEDIMMTYITPNKRTLEFDLPYQRQLSPNGGTMTEFIDGVKGDTFNDGLNVFRLFINYKSVINGNEKKFKSEFFFQVNFHKNLKNPIVYSSAIREEGKFTPQEQLNIIDVENQLFKDSGSYRFIFNEKKLKLNSVTAFAVSKKWKLVYERKSRTLILLELLGDGKTELISQYKFIDEVSKQKDVVIVWTLENVTLYCNGKQLSKKHFQT